MPPGRIDTILDIINRGRIGTSLSAKLTKLQNRGVLTCAWYALSNSTKHITRWDSDNGVQVKDSILISPSVAQTSTVEESKYMIALSTISSSLSSMFSCWAFSTRNMHCARHKEEGHSNQQVVQVVLVNTDSSSRCLHHDTNSIHPQLTFDTIPLRVLSL